MYEQLLDEAVANGLTVIEKYPFESARIRGLCCDDTIAISAQVDTAAERTVVLCEELTHALHSYGNILHDGRMERRTQERIFDRLVGLGGLVKASAAGCRETWEFAEFFGVPERFFNNVMENYRERYGVMKKIKSGGEEFVLSFEPTFRIRKLCTTRHKQKMIRKERAV
ncbi:MAG: hypothetical protein IJW51_04840 [Clostridia bacterium]|nr:hypothetical protein [Clostridia bacterium]MBQ9802378.1 hypothetical protein [Clostridia bacterium]